ncbi:hypothetical protein C8F01DRAFT_1262367 [Mycena amicta]|nr:hypothetical protein C8F01DRAFT_1262367 [Mycena amicta]
MELLRISFHSHRRSLRAFVYHDCHDSDSGHGYFPRWNQSRIGISGAREVGVRPSGAPFVDAHPRNRTLPSTWAPSCSPSISDVESPPRSGLVCLSLVATADSPLRLNDDRWHTFHSLSSFPTSASTSRDLEPSKTRIWVTHKVIIVARRESSSVVALSTVSRLDGPLARPSALLPSNHPVSIVVPPHVTTIDGATGRPLSSEPSTPSFDSILPGVPSRPTTAPPRKHRFVRDEDWETSRRSAAITLRSLASSLQQMPVPPLLALAIHTTSSVLVASANYTSRRYHPQAIDYRGIDPPLHLFLSQSCRPSAQSPSASPGPISSRRYGFAGYRTVPKQARRPCIPGMRRDEIILPAFLVTLLVPVPVDELRMPGNVVDGRPSGADWGRRADWSYAIYLSSTNAHYTLLRILCPFPGTCVGCVADDAGLNHSLKTSQAGSYMGMQRKILVLAVPRHSLSRSLSVYTNALWSRRLPEQDVFQRELPASTS